METHPKALIAFCSLTGNTEEIAIRLSEELGKHGIQTKTEDVIALTAGEFMKYDICVVASYSYESGEETVPEEAMEFFEDLGRLNLTGKIYGVLGSGQEDVYDHFCGAVDRFEEQFKLTKAIRVSDPVKMDFYLSTEEDEQKIKDLANAMATAYSQTHIGKTIITPLR